MKVIKLGLKRKMCVCKGLETASESVCSYWSRRAWMEYPSSCTWHIHPLIVYHQSFSHPSIYLYENRCGSAIIPFCLLRCLSRSRSSRSGSSWWQTEITGSRSRKINAVFRNFPQMKEDKKSDQRCFSFIKTSPEVAWRCRGATKEGGEAEGGKRERGEKYKGDSGGEVRRSREEEIIGSVCILFINPQVS